VAELEHVTDLDGRRDVAEAEVVASATVNPDGDSDHVGSVTFESGRPLVARADTSRPPFVTLSSAAAPDLSPQP
jgi:hypothetical protein